MQSLHTGKSYWQQEITRREYSLAAVKGAAVAVGITFLFYGDIRWLLLPAPLGVLYYRRCVAQCVRKKRQDFEKQFRDALESLSAELNIGYSMENAVKEVLSDLRVMYSEQSLICREFTYMVRQLNLNVTAEQAWRDLEKRVCLPEVSGFVTIFIQAKRSGGDSIMIIRNAVKQMTDKADVKREIETVIAAKKLEFQVMSVIPFGIIGYMRFSFPEFMGLLYGNLFGVCFMSICLGLYLAAWKLGSRIVDIQV